MAQLAADGTKSRPTPKAKPVTLPDFLRICGLDLSDGESFRTFEKMPNLGPALSIVGISTGLDIHDGLDDYS